MSGIFELPPFFAVFDVESIGLHGEGFAVGGVVIDTRTGEEQSSHLLIANVDTARGTADGYRWVKEHVIPALAADAAADFQRGDLSANGAMLPHEVRSMWFNEWWLYWHNRGAVLAADCPWPVEARFLAQCVDDEPKLAGFGPYPLIDVASVRLAAGLDPVAGEYRIGNELPRHNPLADARQSARLLMEALRKGRRS